MKRSGPLRRKTPMPRPTAEMKRTPLERGVTALRRSRINPVSSKRRKENRERRSVKEQLVEERGPWCEVAKAVSARYVEHGLPQNWGTLEVAAVVYHLCTGLADDAHEIVTRGRGGSITDPDNILLVCRRHHDWITTHPKEAHELGLVRHSWEARKGAT